MDRYKILEELGRGGMGIVYKALDTRLQRTVALKMLPPEFAIDEKKKDRLMREARAASALNHPNICTIHDIDEADGQLFLVMEYLPGKTLRDEIASGRLTLDRALLLSSEIADALDKVHQLKILHRDMKPSNIILTEDGHAKIVDFGLAEVEKKIERSDASKVATIDHSLTANGEIAGTLRYMSPEQVRAEELDPRSDIFSFGIVLYEMLTGRPPFEGSSVIELASAILKEEPEPLTKINSAVPFSLDRITRKALEKNRDKRYVSMKELLNDLKNVAKTAEKSVAVLYFENLSGAKEDEYFRDGMTEDIITELWKIKNLKVFPRSAVLAYRNAQIQAVRVGQELSATHVLEGSIRRAGNRIRISGELVETGTGHALWAERMDREMKDVFEVQDEIARSIAQALRITLTPQEEKEIAQKPTINTDAYNYYLKGRSYARRRTRLDLDSALEMFDHAITLDPDFALGYAGIVLVCGLYYNWYGSDPQYISRGLLACERALQLQPALPEAYAGRSIIFYGLKNYDGAISDARIAVHAKPDCPGGYWALSASLFATGHYEEVAAMADDALDKCGDDDNVYVAFVLSLERLGRTEEALRLRQLHARALELQLQLAPDDVRGRILLSNQYAALGREDDAMNQLQIALKERPEDTLVLYNAACTYAKLKRKKEAMELLYEVRKRGFANADWMKHDPDFAFLRGDPDFESLLKN